MIDRTTSTEPFFRELVDRVRPDVSYPAKEYLVGLLVGMESAEIDGSPTCLKVYAGPATVVDLKDAGDQALFVSGFFAEHTVSRGLRPGYYAAIGSAAYLSLARRLRIGIFEELASRFSVLQGALRAVRSHCDTMGLGPMAALEEWARTRSRASEHRLAELGILVPHGMFWTNWST